MSHHSGSGRDKSAQQNKLLMNDYSHAEINQEYFFVSLSKSNNFERASSKKYQNRAHLSGPIRYPAKSAEMEFFKIEQKNARSGRNKIGWTLITMIGPYFGGVHRRD